MPLPDTNPAAEAPVSATERLLALLAETMTTASPKSMLAYKSAYAFSIVCKPWKTSVDEDQARAARDICAGIRDLLKAAPANERGGLRTALHTFESVIDFFEMEGPRAARWSAHDEG